MKKRLICLILTLFFIPMIAHAQGGISVSTRSLSMERGQSQSFTVYANNMIGDISVSSGNGIVASVSPNSLSTGMVGANESKSFTVTVSGVSAGSTTITVRVLDGAATFDEEDISGQTINVSVNVTEPYHEPDPQPTPTPTPTPSQPNTPSPVTAGEDTRSGNTNLSSIKVENYKLDTDDSIHYTLTVPHSVSSVKIEAKAADSKASVSGAGPVTLKVGDNQFEIVVTAENGSKKSYYVKIIRKDTKYPLSDLVGALKDSDDVAVVITDKDVITKSMLEQIQKERKTIRFVRYNEDGSSLYTWIVDGNKLGNLKDFNTGITFKFDDEDVFDELSGYRKGMYVQFAETSGFPKGVSCKVSVGDHFKNDDMINLYSYDKNNKVIELTEKALKVEDGSILFSVKTLSNYFLTKALIEKATSGKSDIYKSVAAVEFVLLFFAVCVFVIIKNKKKKKDVPTAKQPSAPVSPAPEAVKQTPEVVNQTPPSDQPNNQEKSQ